MESSGVTYVPLVKGARGARIDDLLVQAADACGISAEDVEDIHRVTPMQEGLWAVSQGQHKAYTYDLGIELKWYAAKKFKEAWCQVIQTNPILRSCIVELDLGAAIQVAQVVLRAGSIYSSQNEKDNQLHSKGLAHLIFFRSCSDDDLDETTTLQVKLRIHHALFDGWAMRLVLDSLRSAYQGQETLLERPDYRQFIRYLDDQEAADGRNGACHEFWRARLAGCSSTDMVDGGPGLDEEAMTDSTLTFTSERQLSQGTAGSLFTLTTVAQAAWAMLVGAYAGTQDVLFGTIVSGRDAPVEGILDMAGPTMAAIPCRVSIKNEQSVAELLEEVSRGLQAAVPYQHVGLAKICREFGGLETWRIQSLLVCQPPYVDIAGYQSDTKMDGPDWRVVGHVNYVHPYALLIEFWLPPRGIGPVRLTAHYDSRLIDSCQVRMLLEQFSDLIFKLFAGVESGVRVGDICLASSGDLVALRRMNEECPPPIRRCIHQLFTDSVGQSPESVAVHAWDQSLTYRRLDELSDTLSQTLVRHGVRREIRVLVFFPKSAWIVVATMAILKAGGAFVPLDPSHPDGRLQDIVRVSGADISISHPSLTCRLWGITGPRHQILDLSYATTTDLSTGVFHNDVDPSTLAYIMFTSGTTGVPKGVAVEHGAVCSSVSARAGPDAMNMTSSSRVLQFSSYCFDAFIDELFMTLSCGACICIPHADELREDLLGTINRYQITWAFLTPSMARILDPKQLMPGCLNTLTLGGEAALLADVEQWSGHISHLQNGYGPTECCVICVVGDFFAENQGHRRSAHTALMGTPRGCLAWVVDPSNTCRLMPLGAAGELLVEGPNLARGYLENPAATATSWMSNPNWPGGLGCGRRLYRTGDLVRMRPNGSLLYLGRIGGDSQAKLRGQRFELAEVEHHLRNTFPCTQQVAAVIFNPSGARGQQDHDSGESKALALAFVPHGGHVTREQVLLLPLDQRLQEELLRVRHVLETRLPSYMVPTYWIPLREMPVNMSTKVDRRALTQTLESLSREKLAFFLLDDEQGSRKQKPATNCVEKELVKIWSSALGINAADISVSSDFLALGGNSIKAMRLAALCRTNGFPCVSSAAILRLRTIEALAKEAQLVEVKPPAGEQNNERDALPVPFSLLSLGPTSATTGVVLEAATACQVSPSLVQDVYPVTALQKGLFILGLDRDDAYRGLFVYELGQNVDLERLQKAWSDLVEATPILRTRLFKTSSGVMLQAVLQDVIPCNKLSTRLDETLAREREESRKMSFGSLLCRACIVQDVNRSYFVLNAHHAVYDGWSVSNLMRYLKQLYHSPKKQDDNYSTRNHYVRFVDHTSRLDMDGHRRFWRDYLAGSPFTAFPEVKMTSLTKWQPLTNSTTRHVFPFNGARVVRPSVALYSAWAQLAAIYGGTDDVAFGIASTGRDTATPTHSGDIVGPMVTTLLLRVRVPTDCDTPVSALLDTVQQAVAATTPYEQCGLSNISKASAEAATACRFHSLLIIQTPKTTKTTTSDDGDEQQLFVSEKDVGANIHPYPLVLEATLYESLHEINVVAHYDTSLLDEAIVKHLLQQLAHLVQEIVRLGESSGTVGQMNFVSPSDKALINCDSTAVLPVVQSCVHDIICEWASLYPDTPAVCAWDISLSYAELDALSTRLAANLASLGVKKGVFVPICHEKSAWCVVAQVAVLKAGAVCVSIDPSYPKARNDEIIAQCQAQVVIGSSTTKSIFSGPRPAVVVASSQLQAPYALLGPETMAMPGDAAYCVFTSGSTGKPKGIIIEHAALCTSAKHYGAAMRLGPSARVLQFASCTFDVSVGETLSTLMHGGCVCVPRDDERLVDLAGCVNRFQVNWLYLTSSVASMLRPADVQSLETLVVGAEPVRQEVIETWAESGVTLINAYGPAETTIYCSARTVPTKQTDARDIGTALGCRMWIQCYSHENHDGKYTKLAPLGATGEILIEGPILAREYLGQSDETAAHFVNVPWLPSGRRVYRTGDLAFQDAQGHFHFQGRRDSQVKVNGQRVHLGEVEAILASTRADIQQVSAVTFERGRGTSHHAAVQLAAFIVFADTAPPPRLDNTTINSPIEMTDGLRERMLDIRRQLQRFLPRHMIPSIFLPMSSLPRTRTLKLDPKPLRKMIESWTDEYLGSLTLSNRQERTSMAYKAPRSDIESRLLQYWTKALSLSASAHRGVEGNFFHLGGDSMAAMQFLWLARREGDAFHLSVADIYAHPTIPELATLHAARAKDTASVRQKEQTIPLPFSLVTADEKNRVFNEMVQLEIAAEDVEDIYPATASQVGLLLQTEQHKDMWVARDAWEFPTDFDAERLRAAWECVVERNAILRTRIVQVFGSTISHEAYQVVLRHRQVNVWDNRGSHDCIMGFGRALSSHQLRGRTFEWFRHHAVYDGWSSKLLLHQLEHLLRSSDRSTQMLFLPFSCYVARLQSYDTQTARQFWQAELNGIDANALRAASFPRTLLSGPSNGDELPYITRPSLAGCRMTRQITLPEKTSRDTAITIAVLVEAAWALTLSAYAGSADVLFGTVLSGRMTDTCLADVVGPTACIVPRRYQTHDMTEVCVFLENARRKARTAAPHEYAGLRSVQEQLGHHQADPGVPLLNNLLVVQSDTLVTETGDTAQRDLDAIGLKKRLDVPVSHFPFGLVLECIVLNYSTSNTHGYQLQLLAYYDDHQIREEEMQRVVSYFEHTLTQLAMTRPGALLGDIGIWNSSLVQDQMPFIHTAPPPPAVEACVQQLIAQYWERDPPQADAPAVCMAGPNKLFLSYRDLDIISAWLCRHLIWHGDMGFDKQRVPFVAICFEKSPWTVVAMVAVWRAGYGVVLLDATQPQTRRLKMVRKANAGLVLVTPATRPLWQHHDFRVMMVDFSDMSVLNGDGTQMQPVTTTTTATTTWPAKPEDPCYCIFTSGSTGEPKGVVIQHRAIATSAVHHGRTTGLSASSRVLQFSSYSFDVAIDEILTTLIHGGCVCVVSEEDSKARLAEAIGELQVNVALLTPGVLETLDPATVPSLKTVVVGGSSLSASLRRLWEHRVRLLVAYGPSECSVTATMTDTDTRRGAGAYPLNHIGKPVGCRAWVLELGGDDAGDGKSPTRRLRLAPFGIAGELAIEGPILAQGYLDDDDLTSKKFILATTVAGGFCETTACSSHERLYRTGDVVKQLSDGSLLFLGRLDNQVKVRGVRVELEAVEHLILHSHAAIADTVKNVVVVIPLKGPLRDRLVGVLQLQSKETYADTTTAAATSDASSGVVIGQVPQALVKRINEYLSKHVPAPHIPEVWASVSSMPLLLSCKVDRASIQQSLETITQDRYLLLMPPTVNGTRVKVPESKSPTEMKLRDLIGRVLGIDLSSVPSSVTFPQLGGNSLMAMQLVARCKASGVPISLSHLLSHHTIAELSKAATEAKMDRATTTITHGSQRREQPNGVPERGKYHVVPMTPAQRMFFSFYPFGPNYFNQSIFVRIDNSPGLSVEDLQSYLLTLVEHHPPLRSRFLRRRDEPDGAWRWECVITDDVEGSLRFRAHVLRAGQEVESVACITSETHQCLNISDGPLFAADVFFTNGATMHLRLVAHHLVVDIVSWSILLSHLEALLSSVSCPLDTSCYTFSRHSHGEVQQCEADDDDKPSVKNETLDFWGIDGNRAMAVQKAPAKWTASLNSTLTCALLADISAIEELDLADVVEAALGDAFAEICRGSGRKSSPLMFVEENGRGYDDEHGSNTMAVGWLTKVRPVSLSSTMSFVQRIWQARHNRLTSRGGNHNKVIPCLPFELVLNYVGPPPISSSKTASRLYEHVTPSPLSRAAMTVPDTDPYLKPLALIEVVASLGGSGGDRGGLALSVTCDGRLQHVERVHACIDSCLRRLQVNASAVLGSSESRLSLRSLGPAIDTEDYQTSQRRRSHVLKALALDDVDDVQTVLACTPAQARILLGQAREPRHYQVQVVWQVTTAHGCSPDRIDADKLQMACDEVVRHHASLRTEFLQLPDLAAPVQVVVMRRNPSANRNILRVHRVSEGILQVELDIAHAAFDGASTATVLRDLELAYCDKPLSTDNTHTLSRYVAYVEQSDLKAANAFWSQHLADAQPCHLPPLGGSDDGEADPFGSFDYILDGELETAMRTWCLRFKATPAVAIHIAWAWTLAAYTGLEDICFGWMTSGRDAPVLGIEDAVGMFANLIVCRVNMAAGNCIKDIVDAMVWELASGLEHQLGSPPLCQRDQRLFDTLVTVQSAAAAAAASGPGGDHDDDLLVFHQLHGVDRTGFALVLNAGITRGMIEFRLTYNTDKISCAAARSCFAAFAQALGTLTTVEDDNTKMTLATIDLYSQFHHQIGLDFNAKSEQTLSNGTLEAKVGHTIPALFSRQVELRPDAVAVDSWDGRLTFSELDHMSAGLCRVLYRIGLTRGQVVPLLCDKSAWVVVSIVAILRAGATCVFLSPSDGICRLREIIIGQIGAKIILASHNHSEKARALDCGNLVVATLHPKLCVLQQKYHLPFQDIGTEGPIIDDSRSEDVAFVVFTSGSTGKPKGITLPHASLCFSVLEYSRRLGISEQSRIFQFSAYTFDVAIGDIVAALIHGATLCIPSEQDRTSDLNGALQRSKSTCLMIAPSAAALLVPPEKGNTTCLQSLVLIGEVPTPELYRRWHGRVKLFNAWGPAECAVLSSAHEVQSPSELPSLIGVPMSSCRLWLVSPSDPSRFVPSGCVGEILVEGPNVAYGYLNDQERTQQVFITTDKVPSALKQQRRQQQRALSNPRSRFYLTGDLARYVPHKGLVFAGRKDLQIKVRGQRVELGEIESHLCRRAQEAIDKLEFCSSNRVLGAVDVFDQRNGEKGLAAFINVYQADDKTTGAVVANNAAEICELSHLLGVAVDETFFYEQLKQQLRHDLAEYMVPQAFFTISALPRLSSGKLDRKFLRRLGQTHSGVTHERLKKEDPTNQGATAAAVLTDPSQKRLRTLWSQLLQVDEAAIGPNSNFFQLGGDSVSAMRLAAATIKEGIKQLTVLKIMKFPELSAMAAQISVPNGDVGLKQSEEAGQTGCVSKKPLLTDHIANCHEFPATNLQCAMVRFNMEPGRGCMNYFILRFAAGVNQDVLEVACRAWLAHHAVLRSCFERRGDKLTQRIMPNVSAVDMIKHYPGGEDDLDALTARVIESDRAAALPWGQCLTRLFFFVARDGVGASRLIIRLSHAVYDGMCLPALWRDLSRAYAGRRLGPESVLFPQFAESAAKLSPDAVQVWGDILRGSQMTGVVPSPRPSSGCATGRLMEGRASCAIPSDHFALLSSSSSRTTTPASTLKAAWAVVLACLSHSEDVVFGHVVSCRETLPCSMHETLGAFVNCIPVRVALLRPMPAARLVEKVHEQHLATLPHNQVGLQQLVESRCADWPADVRFSSVLQYQNLPHSSSSSPSSSSSSRSATEGDDGLYAIGSGPLAGTEIRVEGRAGAYCDLWIMATPVGESTDVNVVFDEAVVTPQLVHNLIKALCEVMRHIYRENGMLTTGKLLDIAGNCIY